MDVPIPKNDTNASIGENLCRMWIVDGWQNLAFWNVRHG
jgi:hypothetical protein